LAVAQVDEDHAAVVAPAVRPSEDGDGLAEITGVDVAAVVGSHSFVIPVQTGIHSFVLASMGPRRHGDDGPGWSRRAVAYVLGDGSGLGSVPERFLSGLGKRCRGSATPIEMMYLRASSTVISRGCVSERGTTRKNPAVMFGVVGTKTEICSRPRMSATSFSGVPVTSATVQACVCGKRTRTARRKALPSGENSVSLICFTPP